MKGRETELWLSKNGIPKKLINDIKPQIMDKVQQELEGNRDADMDKIFSSLPLDLQSRITKYMPMARLKQVPALKKMDERVLRRISQRLKPREFDDDSIIIEKGEPLKMMVFIVDGLVSIEKRDGSSSSNDNLQQPTRGAGEVCGEELLRWPLSSILFWAGESPLATESAKAIGHVEALVVTAFDLNRVLIDRDYFVGMMRRTFSAKELEKATDNYHESRIIRKDEDATFYKGVVPMPDDDKTVVAVKKYETNKTYAVIEAAVASQTNHINVVRFLGGCVVEEEKESALVFEYIPNGTLFEHIHKEEAAGSFEGSSSSPTALLSLESRLKIASETAGALAYLHSLTPPIIHLFLSTKHVLLDDHYTAKLSAIGQWQAAFHTSDLLKEGYTDPHFRRDGLAEKSDVYSFGVVLAELLTSQKPASPNNRGEEPPLATCLLSSMKEDRLNQILDGEIIVNEATSKTAKKVADLAKRCLRSKREERPSMEQVAVELEGLRKFMAEHERGQPSFSIRPNSN
ncbi:wall-associated receptor kinase 2-like [Prunus avium]|uniref:Wall-associated receptor kinase 2-like n=1 Tax=Prunus avium TaxID=42229 RepID=A0A6P5TVP5_PRUAV|nr:wall-associated receptor kinase 2-like [Prunus avium]